MNKKEHIGLIIKYLRMYCEKEKYMGFDPFDGLNSNLLNKIPAFFKNKFLKLCWIQFFKKSPINFRALAGIEKQTNPKGLGIFLSAYCEMEKYEHDENNLNKIKQLINNINQQKIPGYSGDCWGYPFDWQSRAFFLPKKTPNIVTSCFIANALLDAYEINHDKKLFFSARSTCHFIMNDLNKITHQPNNISVSYSPIDFSVVYNVSFLGSQLLSRVFSISKEIELYNFSTSMINYGCSKQHTNGSWSYGNQPFHQWIDNFHTGYNLVSIADYMKFTGNTNYKNHLNKGFEYYIINFFTKNGEPKYYHNKKYPIDIHSTAQLILTLSKLDKMEEYKSLLDQVLSWTIQHMRSEKGYFFYQINRFYKNKISYMRWSQAWMLLSLVIYYNHINNNFYNTHE